MDLPPPPQFLLSQCPPQTISGAATDCYVSLKILFKTWRSSLPLRMAMVNKHGFVITTQLKFKKIVLIISKLHLIIVLISHTAYHQVLINDGVLLMTSPDIVKIFLINELIVMICIDIIKIWELFDQLELCYMTEIWLQSWKGMVGTLNDTTYDNHPYKLDYAHNIFEMLC